MTENDAYDVNRPEGASECVLWFFDHLTFSHLDEVPIEHLKEIIMDEQRCAQCSHIIFSGKFCGGQTEDPIVLSSWLNKIKSMDTRQLHYFGSWCMAELGRRWEIIDFTPEDVLVRDMITDESMFRRKKIGYWVELNLKIKDMIKKEKA